MSPSGPRAGPTPGSPYRAPAPRAPEPRERRAALIHTSVRAIRAWCAEDCGVYLNIKHEIAFIDGRTGARRLIAAFPPDAPGEFVSLAADEASLYTVRRPMTGSAGLWRIPKRGGDATLLAEVAGEPDAQIFAPFVRPGPVLETLITYLSQWLRPGVEVKLIEVPPGGPRVALGAWDLRCDRVLATGADRAGVHAIIQRARWLRAPAEQLVWLPVGGEPAALVSWTTPRGSAPLVEIRLAPRVVYWRVDRQILRLDRRDAPPAPAT